MSQQWTGKQAGVYTSGHIKTVSAKQGVGYLRSSLDTSSLSTTLTRSWVLGRGFLVFVFGFGFSGKDTNGAKEPIEYKLTFDI